MGASEAPCVSTRLKREDCKRTKHDSVFSDWKILIGPSDWEDHSLGKEGAARYRVHNLPNCCSCSGVYELGIAVPHTRSGREVSKLEPDHIIPVYLGQADNVRTRLQRYGQAGAHLENGNSTGELNDSVQKGGPGLFMEIFSRGFPIVFRWVPMKNKRDAEKTEAQLLDTFDYAWNKGSNGTRRPDDILQKLDRSISGTSRFPAIARKLQTFRQKRVGLRIEAYKPLLLENGSSIYTNPESNDILSRIFRFGRSHPRLVSMRFGVNEDHDNICGVAVGHGSVCRRPPVEGRKRCAEHKGMKINGSISKLITEGKSPDGDLSIESGHYIVKPQLVAGNPPVNEANFPICGVPLDDGSPCGMQPLQGRKRCEEHKGRKIHRSVSLSVSERKQHYVCGPVLESSTSNNNEQVSSETRQTGTLQSQAFSERSVVNKEYNTICGVDLEDGTICTRQPVVGRKRCEEHKGMRVKKSMSKSSVADIPSVFDGSGIRTCNDRKYDNTSSQSVSYRNAVNEDFSSTCGAPLANGLFCRRQPVEGLKRCWQHKGMRVNSSSAKGMVVNGTMTKVVEDKSGMYTGSGISTCNDWKYNNASSSSVSYNCVVNEDFSSTCGATLSDGSFCRSQPAEGRKRCWQHKGTRANSSLSYISNSMYDSEGISSHICGAAIQNGSICRRTPVRGRKRCEQHKGMRAATTYNF